MPIFRLLRSALRCLPLLAVPLAAQQGIRGTVFVDANANGARDPGERGIAGVAVSNQDDVAVTDANGAYSLRAAPTGIVFVSVPDGYRAIGTFWKSAASPTIDFPLGAVPRVTTFSFVAASDPHTMVKRNGVLMFRHTVSNNIPALEVLGKRRHVLAIGAHSHAAERLTFQMRGQMARFENTAAIVGPSPVSQSMLSPSGFTVYSVRNGVTDAGTFVPLDARQ